MLNGRWFPQIVDRDSGNLYPIYPPYGGGGGCCKQFFLRKTILSHLISWRFMRFPTFFVGKY